MDDLERELLWLRRVRDLAQALATQTDLPKLLPRILDAAIEITGAERGYLVRVGDKNPSGGYDVRVEAARGFNQSRLSGARSDVSRTVVERVLDGGQGLVTTREEDADVLDASSVMARRVRSILCVPMRLRDALRGVLYLDHRHRQGAFQERDIEILGTFADQAAVAIETAELRAALEPAEPSASPILFGSLVGGSATSAMGAVYEEIARAARSWDPVLLLGESGSGKTSVAREIHARSELPNQPFLRQACAAVSESELESELLTKLQQAERGTLVLDDVADLGIALQGRLAGILRDGHSRCRVVTATTHDLRARVDEGTFRADLYYRLDVQRIVIPPLRARIEDLPALIDHFAEQIEGRRFQLTGHAHKLLAGYTWPGNLQELRNEVQRLLATQVDPITARQLSPEVREGRGVARASGALAGRTLGEVEREMIVTALKDTLGNKARAARQLGIPRSTLYGLLQRYGLS